MENPFSEILNELKELKTNFQELRNKLEVEPYKIYSVKELSILSGASELTIRNWIKEGKIKANRIGRKLFIEHSQFENGLQEVKSLKYKR
jgi:excisionase family DNA binding protein